MATSTTHMRMKEMTSWRHCLYTTSSRTDQLHRWVLAPLSTASAKASEAAATMARRIPVAGDRNVLWVRRGHRRAHTTPRPHASLDWACLHPPSLTRFDLPPRRDRGLAKAGSGHRKRLTYKSCGKTMLVNTLLLIRTVLGTTQIRKERRPRQKAPTMTDSRRRPSCSTETIRCRSAKKT